MKNKENVSADVTGFTAPYIDPNTGMELPDAWINIRQINYIPYGSCLVVTDIYKDYAAYVSGMAAVFNNVVPPVDYNTTEWNTYFDTSILSQANHDILAQSIAFLETIF